MLFWALDNSAPKSSQGTSPDPRSRTGLLSTAPTPARSTRPRSVNTPLAGSQGQSFIATLWQVSEAGSARRANRKQPWH